MSTVLMTGATSGIGLELFNKYVEQGYDVIACGRNQEKLTELEPKAKATMRFDVNEPEQIKSAIQSFEGNIDIAILNAGDCRYIDDVVNFDGQLFADVINTNLTSMGFLLQNILPKLSANGQLVLVSSSATILPFSRAQAYGASKAGLDYLANSLRIDLAPKNISVSLVHPGFIKTPLTDRNDFPMPFIISSEEAAIRIYKGVSARKPYIHFPKRLTLLLKLIAWLPDIIWHKIATKGLSK
ncbi:MAG: SDR family NAD(P)-dependent oxidoreductase [Gammaproteobacteria bacterium]|nr:SDR family NAD(P)-dependent oxidoreductase [Gammaproteobacteria bacterium]